MNTDSSSMQTASVINDAIWDWELATNKLSWNDNLKIIFGYEENDTETKIDWWHNKIHPDDRGRVVKGIHHAINNKIRNWSDQYRFLRSDGSFTHVFDRGFIIFEKDDPVRIVGSMLDLSYQHKLEKEKQENEVHFKFALEAAGLGTWSYHSQTNSIEWDDNGCKLSGFINEKSIDFNKFLKHVHPADAKNLQEAFNAALRPSSNGELNIEFRLTTEEDKQLRWLRYKGKAYFNSQNIAHHFEGIVQDITKEVLDGHEQQMLLILVDNSLDFMALATAKGKLKYLNKTGRDLVGLDANTNITQFEVRDFYAPEHFHRLQQEILPELFNKGKWTGTLYLQHFKTKESIPCNAEMITIKDSATGEIRLRGVTIRDLRSEKAAQEEQLKLLSLVDNSVDIMFILDMDGHLIYMNKAGRKLTGLGEHEELNNIHIKEFHTEDQLEIVMNEVAQTVKQEGKWSGRIGIKNRKTGDKIPVHNYAIRIDDPGTKKPLAIGSVMRDLRPEIEAQKEQQKLLFLLENINDFVSLSDSEGNVSYVNAAGLKMMGLDNLEQAKRHNSEYVMPTQLDKLKTEIRTSLFTEGKWTGEVLYRHFKTGEAIPILGTTMMVQDVLTGELQGRATISRDLRPEIEAQKALIESEKRFRTMVAQAPVAIGVFRGDHFIIEFANKPLLDIWGQTERVIGLRLLEALPEIKDQPFPALMKEVYTTGQPFFGYEELAKIYKDGVLTDGFYNYMFTPARETDGSVSGVILVSIEVTAQVLAKKKLEESENRFRKLILEAPMATALYAGEEMIIEVANEAMLKLWGKDASVVGKKLADALPELEGQPFLDLLNEVYTTGIPYHADAQKANLIVNGKLQSFWFNFTYKPLHDESGKIYAILNMAVDVTKQIQLQKQKDEFIGIASHELKTPVTSIKGFAQILEQSFNKKGEEREVLMLNKMNAQINKLTILISDLLDVTKIQAGKLQFNESFFNFNNLVEETVEQIQRTTAKHVIIKKLSEVGAIYADRYRIEQVLSNLLTNAIKYSPQSDKVIISTHKENGEIICSVQDFGIGIHEENILRVFDQFYRVSTETQNTFPGLGLGLYISHEIVTREGGRMWVVSKLGEGSVFSFALPVNHRENEKHNDRW